jgi:hypothetical protein
MLPPKYQVPGAGRRQRQQREGQRVVVQPCGFFQCRDVFSRQQGREMLIRQNRGQS